MALYSYRVRTKTGEALQGTIDADGEQEAVAKLRGQGYIVTHVGLNNDLLAARQSPKVKGKKKVTLKDLAIFSRQMATLINAGVPILTALGVLKAQTSSVKLALALETVAQDLKTGHGLAAALRQHPQVFPEMMVNTVAAGEIGGALDEVLERVAGHFEKEYDFSQKMKTALSYPTVVLIASVLVVVFLLIFVLPTFVDMFASMGAALPLPTRILLGTGTFLRKFWYLVASVVGALIYVLKRWSQTEGGRQLIDGTKIKLPILGPLFLGRTVSSFARSMAILVKSGVPIMASLTVVERIVDNVLVRDALRRAQQSVRSGLSLAGPLSESAVLPPLVVQMISIGEETGHLDAMLDKVADFYDRDVDAIVARLGTTLEPVMIGFLAIVVGSIVLAVVMPMMGQIGLIGGM